LRPARAAAVTAALLGLGRAAPAAAQPSDAALARRYGDAGSAEVSLLLGFSSEGWAAGGGFRYFVVDMLAPGVEASVERDHGLTQGFTFASLRLVPLRFASAALVLTGRAGRVFLSDHADGWAAGGDLGVLLMLSPQVGLEIGYEVLRLLPDSFCADFVSCVLQRPVLGVRITF
jgi:hypothetical protein